MSSKGTEKPLTQKIFIKLNHILDKFDNIKETNNIEDIINCFYEILKVFSYWDN